MVKCELDRPWRRVAILDLIEQRTGERMHPSMPIGQARAICDRLAIPYKASENAGELIVDVYERECEPTLIEPTFVCDLPVAVSPLARVHPDDPYLAERFELVVGGRELANAYSELNDPVDQRQRFEEQARRKGGEQEPIDEEYLRALDFGLPPTGGLGIGVDRLVMLLTEATTIRDVILFPTMRPKRGPIAAPDVSEAVPTAQALAQLSPEPSREPLAVDPAAELPVGDQQPENLLPHGRIAMTLAILTALGGLLFLIPRLPQLRDQLGVFEVVLLPQDERIAGNVASVVIGLLLLTIAPHLAHHKRRAWRER